MPSSTMNSTVGSTACAPQARTSAAGTTPSRWPSPPMVGIPSSRPPNHRGISLPASRIRTRTPLALTAFSSRATSSRRRISITCSCALMSIGRTASACACCEPLTWTIHPRGAPGTARISTCRWEAPTCWKRARTVAALRCHGSGPGSPAIRHHVQPSGASRARSPDEWPRGTLPSIILLVLLASLFHRHGGQVWRTSSRAGRAV